MKNRIFFVLLTLTGFLVSCKHEPEEETMPVKPATPYALEIPKGFPAMTIPQDNALTIEGVALGRKLFYDKILSKNNVQSCGSCHNQSLSFSDNGKVFSTGVDGIEGTRNAQALVNPGFNLHYFWDGRSKTLELQALEPVKNPLEMNTNWKSVTAKIKARPDYVSDFLKAFGKRDIDSVLVAKALAQFMRTFISSNSRFDKYVRHESSLTPSELNGYVIFNTERGDCFHCHNIDGGRLITDNLFHNNGLDAQFTDLGLSEISGLPSDRGKFLTPTLRNIERSAPYMHDGRFQTLEEVVDHYNSGGNPSPTIDPLMKHVGTGLNLSTQEKTDLIAFLRSLTDEAYLSNPSYSDPN